MFGPRFALFADMLAVGITTAVVCLPVVTAPAALAAACSVLRGAIREDRTVTVGRYAAALRAHGLPRTLAAGATVLGVAALLGLDLLLARAGLPGAPAVSAALAVLAAAALVVGLRAAADPAAAASWRTALRNASARAVADPGGCVLTAVAVVLCGAFVWMLPLLAPLVLGPLAFAVTVIELRATGNSRTSEG
ncbi:hypothetical protein DVA86_24065 [Streptomyces armeniacus]|uniref:DUF624 domain-containing protein n=1 Tax=Streptomyces armeniacus TaxID=83291 RepID=A0A345Y138_9ACTN|nr:hypothetical protein DVA86_24065 [Streptomyces armeniacus]